MCSTTSVLVKSCLFRPIRHRASSKKPLIHFPSRFRHRLFFSSETSQKKEFSFSKYFIGNSSRISLSAFQIVQRFLKYIKIMVGLSVCHLLLEQKCPPDDQLILMTRKADGHLAVLHYRDRKVDFSAHAGMDAAIWQFLLLNLLPRHPRLSLLLMLLLPPLLLLLLLLLLMLLLDFIPSTPFQVPYCLYPIPCANSLG